MDSMMMRSAAARGLDEQSSVARIPTESMVVPAGSSASPSVATQPTRSFADALVELLAELGVEYAFGMFGGGIAPFCEALHRSSIQLLHFRHEAGAAFAAVEASLASGRPVVVVATTGPGMTNLLTGMVAARWEGAKVIFVSGTTPAAQRGRSSFQETSQYAPGLSDMFTTGPLFHHAGVIEDAVELDLLRARLASGVARPTGFVAHLGLPTNVQAARTAASSGRRLCALSTPVCDAATVERCAALLASNKFVIWAGFGARDASAQVRALAERSGAAVMCSPRGKGIMPEDHPQFLGVTGLGGHASVDVYMRSKRPAHVLVLGTRLGEFTSFWSPDLVPSESFVHVDLEPDAFGTAYPEVETVGVQAEIGAFLDALLARWPEHASKQASESVRALPSLPSMREQGPVRPSFLMHEVQRRIVERSDALVITEAGNAFALGSHYLRFAEPHRYRVSSGFGSMGHASGGVIGAALGRRGKAVAILGDGAMMMLNELNTARAYDVDALWIVLNDARYGMIAQGMQSIGWKPFEVEFPRADFVSIARALGAQALQVERECDVAAALEQAMSARGPFLLDVAIDPDELAPAGRRNQSLAKQGVGR